jgi:signal transduction histidine kinase
MLRAVKRTILFTELGLLTFFALVGGLYIFFTVDVNAVQRWWEVFCFVWEGLVFGLPLVLWQPLFRRLAPYVRRLEAGEQLSDDEVGRYQRLVLTYPAQVSLVVLGGTLLVYGLLAAQLRVFAALAWEGCAVILVCGVVAGLLWAVVDYFLVEHAVRPLTALIAPRAGARVWRLPVGVKIFSCGFALVTAGLGFFGVTAYTRAARIVEQQVAERSLATVQEIANLTFELPQTEAGTVSDLWWAPATEYRISPRGYLHLLDATGKLIHTHPALEGYDKRHLRDERLLPAVIEHILRTPEGTIVDRVGTPKIIAFTTVPDRPLKLVAIAPRSDFRVYLDHFLSAGLAAMAFALLLSIAIGSLTARSLITPLAEVTRTARAMARGRDLRRRVAFLTNDEVGLLGAAFNAMAAELQTYAEGLERLVAERTRALEARSEELRAKHQELSDFLYVVSHDLRAPLINLEGFSRALTNSVAAYERARAAAPANGGTTDPWPGAREDIDEALGFILRSVKKIDLLAKGLLELSRIDTRPHLPQRIDTAKMVDEILGSLQYQIVQRQVTVHVGPLPVVRGDPVRLNQVFSNLIDNAIKYMKAAGEARIDIGCEATGDGYRFFVRDTGLGIRPEDRAKVFRLFTRLGANGIPGEGIGLAAVKKIVEKHGGQIWVESELGAGSTFSFTLPQPVDDERTNDAEPDAAQDPAGGG